MADDNRKKWHRLPRIKFNRKSITKRARKFEAVTIRHARKFVFKRWGNIRDVQQHVVIWILMMGILIAATGLQLMWYQQSYKVLAPRTDGTYAEAVLGPVNTLNPIFANSSAEQSASYLMFSRLMRYDTTGTLGYDLATDIKLNEAKTVYTVSIRPDVKWHDGTKLTADDIAFTINLIKNPNVRSTITGWHDISIKVINQTTIEFILKSTYSAFEHVLTFPILPKHVLGNVAPANIRENNFSQNPIGSGPFKLRFTQDVDINTSRKIVYMARNDNYYHDMAKLAHFQLHVYSTTDDIVNALSSNEVNAANDLLPNDIAQINQKKYTVLSKPIQSGVYAILNTKSTLVSDPQIRKALQVGTDTVAIRGKLSVKALALDLPLMNNQLIGDVPKLPGYNQASAMKILDDAGWKLNSTNVRVKDSKELKLSVVTLKNSEFEGVLETISGQWRKLGISIDTKVLDPADVTQNAIQTILQPRNFDVLLYQLNIGADPDVYAYWHSSQATSQGSNFSNYSNVISDDALLSARARVEPSLRNAKYLTFVRQWLVDVPAIGLYQSTTQYARSSNVKSFDNSVVLVSSIDRYSDVLNWSVGTNKVYKTP